MNTFTLSKEDCLQMLEEYKKEFKKLAARCHKLEKLHRERSNAERGLRPKKEHIGYVPIKSAVYTAKFKAEANITAEDIFSGEALKKMPKTENILAIKITYQTPYADTVPYGDAFDMIAKFFAEGVPTLGIDGINLTQKYHRYSDGSGKELNYVWKMELSANHIKGYWEVILFTTKKVDGSPAGAESNSMEDEKYEYEPVK